MLSFLCCIVCVWFQLFFEIVNNGSLKRIFSCQIKPLNMRDSKLIFLLNQFVYLRENLDCVIYGLGRDQDLAKFKKNHLN